MRIKYDSISADKKLGIVLDQHYIHSDEQINK